MANTFDGLSSQDRKAGVRHLPLLQDDVRLSAFEAALDYAVKPGARVVDLGGNQGVLSALAARKAERVYCVEPMPAAAKGAHAFLERQGVLGRVSVVDADPRYYLPPEPVDVVLCDRLYPGLLGEGQVALVSAFKKRYAKRFGPRLPAFIPDAVVLAVQAVTHDFGDGANEPAACLTDAASAARTTAGVAAPDIYAIFEYRSDFDERLAFDRTLQITQGGSLNALRFITKNLIAIVHEESRSIDWDMPQLIIPLASPLGVSESEHVRVRFAYEGGASVAALGAAITVERVSAGPTA